LRTGSKKLGQNTGPVRGASRAKRLCCSGKSTIPSTSRGDFGGNSAGRKAKKKVEQRHTGHRKSMLVINTHGEGGFGTSEKRIRKKKTARKFYWALPNMDRT